MKNNIYTYFDDIICINLETRLDRREYVSNIFNKLSIPVRFYNVQKNSKGSIYGCFESHINIIKEAYYNNKNKILIFEDDIIPTKSYNIDNIQNAITFMKNNYWDIFYFGYFPFNNFPYIRNNIINKSFINATKISSNIVKYNPYATHAYCLNRIGMKIILNNYQDIIIQNIHIDAYYADYLKLQSYCYTPILFEQHFCIGSDNALKNFQNFSCIIEKTKINWYISLFKYYKNIIYLWLIIIIIFIFILIKI